MTPTFREDDLTGEAVRALVAHHLAGMRASSPACAVHAYDIDRLRGPSVTFYSGWDADTLVACGALNALGGGEGELKSMRVADAARGRGAGRALLEHLIDEARARGWTRLWLETGTGETFADAWRLYERAGFVGCGPFAGYRDNGFSRFMTREI